MSLKGDASSMNRIEILYLREPANGKVDYQQEAELFI